MLSIDPASPIPINDQIKSGLRGLVTRGLLKPGDAAPSVRGLAATLKVNPNTVARALRELTIEGFIESRRGENGVIGEGARERAADGLDESRRGFQEAVHQARRSGLSWTELAMLVRKARREP